MKTIKRHFNFLTLLTLVTMAAAGFALFAPQTAQAISYNATTYPAPQSYTNIATNTTTVVKKGQGVLDAIVINTVGASANTITVYDNTAGSGTKIATIDGTLAGGTRIIYNVAFGTGLTVVTATGTAANITVAYH